MRNAQLIACTFICIFIQYSNTRDMEKILKALGLTDDQLADLKDGKLDHDAAVAAINEKMADFVKKANEREYQLQAQKAFYAQKEQEMAEKLGIDYAQYKDFDEKGRYEKIVEDGLKKKQALLQQKEQEMADFKKQIEGANEKTVSQLREQLDAANQRYKTELETLQAQLADTEKTWATKWEQRQLQDAFMVEFNSVLQSPDLKDKILFPPHTLQTLLENEIRTRELQRKVIKKDDQQTIEFNRADGSIAVKRPGEFLTLRDLVLEVAEKNGGIRKSNGTPPGNPKTIVNPSDIANKAGFSPEMLKWLNKSNEPTS